MSHDELRALRDRRNSLYAQLERTPRTEISTVQAALDAVEERISEAMKVAA